MNASNEQGAMPTNVAARRLDPGLIRLAAVLLTGILAVVFDTTVVNVALHTLEARLHVGVDAVQWVTTGYLLALGMVVPVSGWLIGRYDGKVVWIAALGLFLAGSIGAGLAWNAPSLIGFRVVQGVAGGVLIPVLTTLIVQAAGGRSLGSVISVVALPVLLGPVLGPLIGGLIVEHLSWRWIFWVNLPLCVTGLVLAWRLMPSFPGTSRTRLDVPGLLLVSPGVAAVLYGLAQVAPAHGFGHARAAVPAVAGVALLAAFTVRALRKGAAALVDLRLLRVPSFAAAGGLLFLSGFALYGGMLLVPLYFQQVRGMGAFDAGLLIAAQGLGVLASRPLAGPLSDRVGPRRITFAGLAVVLAATVPFAFVTTHTDVTALVAALILRGAGLGAATISVMAAAYTGLDRAAIPHASVITRTLQQVGGSFGTAALAVILAGAADRAHPAAAFDTAFRWSIGFTLAALALTTWLPARGDTPRPA